MISCSRPNPTCDGRDLPALAQAMCSRHEGIGADGLMIYAFEPSARAHAAVQRRWQPVRSVGQRHSLPGGAGRPRAPGHDRRSRSTRRPGEKCSSCRGADGDALTFRAAMGMPQDIRSDRNRGRRRERAGGRAVGRKSSVRAARRSAARVAAPHARSGHRTPSEISRSHERVVRESGSARPRAHPDLGARRRPNPGLGHRRVRRGGGRGRPTAARRGTSKSSRRAAASVSNGSMTGSI